MTWHAWTHRIVLWGALNILATLATWGAWDLWLIREGELSGNSASGIVLETTSRFPAFAFLFGGLLASLHWTWEGLLGICVGVLVGHFTWPQRRE